MMRAGADTKTTRAALIVALIAAASGGVAQGARPPKVLRDPAFTAKSPTAQHRIDVADAALALINRAERRVRAARASCRPSMLPPKTTFTDDDPSPALLNTIAPLRRPADQADTMAAASLEGPQGSSLPAEGVYRRYVRVVHAADGRAFGVIAAQNTNTLAYVESASCLDAGRAELGRLLRGQPAEVRSAALSTYSTIRDGREKTDVTPREGIYLFELAADGRASAGGGGGGVVSFERRGTFLSSGGAVGSRLSGLVPDGVASITFTFPRVVSLGRDFKPKVFRSTVTRTVRVRDNVVSLRVPRPAGFAFRTRMVWRDAAGRVVQSVRTP